MWGETAVAVAVVLLAAGAAVGLEAAGIGTRLLFVLLAVGVAGTAAAGWLERKKEVRNDAAV